MLHLKVISQQQNETECQLQQQSYERISHAKEKPAILKITYSYAESFIPKLSSGNFPKPLSDFNNQNMLNVGYLELLIECEKIFRTDIKVYDNNE